MMRDTSLPPPLVEDLVSDSDDDDDDDDDSSNNNGSQTMDGNNCGSDSNSDSVNDADNNNDIAEHMEHKKKLLLLQRRVKLISILERHEEFPPPIRKKIDKLVESLGNAVCDLLLCNDDDDSDAPLRVLDDNCSSSLLSIASDENRMFI